MDEDGDEEDAVKVRDRSSGANDSTPQETHNPVGDVILVVSNVSRVIYDALRTKTYGFSRVLPPSARQKAVSARHDLRIIITTRKKKDSYP